MKILKNKVRDGNCFLYSFDLDQCYHPKSYPAGLLILYTIARCDSIPVDGILFDRWGDIHDGGVRETYSRGLFAKKFPSFEKFCSRINDTDVGPWLVKLDDGTSISGETDSAVTVFAENDTVHFARLFAGIEDDTYAFHEYPESLVQYLQKKEKITLRSSVQILEHISSRPDIYREFYHCVQSGEYVAADIPVKVEGYTAWQLVSEAGLHPVGAYSTLVDLLNDPRRTNELIKNGFVRK